MEVSELLKRIAEEELEMLYLRATDYDANVRIEDIDLQGLPIMIYNNLLEVNYEALASTIATYPLEIRFLKLGYFDNDTEDADYIINRCRTLAEKCAKLLAGEEFIIPAEDFSIDALTTFEIYDEIMTGVTLSYELQFQISC